MKLTRLIITTALLLSSFSVFAQTPTRRTIVVRDGKVVSSSEGPLRDAFLLDADWFGGKRAHLGVSLVDLNDELRQHFGAPKDAGLLVSSVEDGSPADKSGIQTGDIIIAIDGKDVESASELRKALREKKDGDTVRVEVLRGRARQTFVATVVEKEGVRIMNPRELEGLRLFEGPEWKGRIESLGDCATLQSRIKELETRLKDLEKKLQK
jgi:membrane-associated protease RseP (regulator of RpoE activity)